MNTARILVLTIALGAAGGVAASLAIRPGLGQPVKPDGAHLPTRPTASNSFIRHNDRSDALWMTGTIASAPLTVGDSEGTERTAV